MEETRRSKASANDAVLRVEGLRTHFHVRAGVIRAVDGVSFTVGEGETVALVGESGCGKSVTSLSILRLVQSPPGHIVAGRILFEGRDVLELDDRAMRDLRGNRIAMIFQEPMTSLNPAITIGRQIAETLEVHRALSRDEAARRAVAMLERVHIPEARRRAAQYPHELSGGMRQRVMIAMALACEPRVLIADEPTTALDVTIQAQVLELVRELAAATGTAVVLITHDLGVVAEMAQRVVVMYAGQVVEESPVLDLFASPRHPYTRGLLDSMPRLGRTGRLAEIPGMVPALLDPPAGCLFAPRCTRATQQCADSRPELVPDASGRKVACWHPLA